MSDRAFQQLLIFAAAALLAIGIGSVWPPGLMVLGLVGLVLALLIEPEDGEKK